MSIFEDVSRFTIPGKPIVALWSTGGTSAYGSLIWVNKKPILTLYMDDINPEGILHEKSRLLLIVETNPPKLSTITAITHEFGVITLENCARYNIRSNNSIRDVKTRYELDLMPAAIWIGDPKEIVEGAVESVTASDHRLAGFFGSPGLTTHSNYDDRFNDAFEKLNNPKTIWALHGPEIHQVALGETGWLLSLHTTALDGVSATEGYSVKSTVNITLHAPERSTIKDASQNLSKIEEILSVFSIEPFRFQIERYNSGNGNTVNLIWHLGQDGSIFNPPMRHQILVDLRCKETLAAVCRQWFVDTPDINLSRWLFVRALRETDDGLARFIAVAQAFEVLGREFGPGKKTSKSELANAAKLIEESLNGNFENEFIARISGLVKSSNKASFRDTLDYLISQSLRNIDGYSKGDLDKFCKLVADTRNTVVHMSNKEKGSLNKAFSKVNKLSRQLCFWYAVCQADILQLPIPKIKSFLVNNRNTRHGLPNEILDRQ